MRPQVARAFNLFTRLPRAQRVAARLHGRLFRLTGGRAIGRWFGAPVVVLETVGRRSGRARATPIIYMPDGRGDEGGGNGERMVVTPANAGSEQTPAWWLNLQAAGWGVAMRGGRRQRVVPRVAEGEERRRLWQRFAERFPALDLYTEYTQREFPIVVLEPAGAADYPPGD
jgi:deazaflavin-dependent oxidoreductase (nitroreductase family)